MLELPRMVARVGIGVNTYNRKDVLAETLARVRTHTTSPCELVVADNGSWDGTVELVRSLDIRLVSGRDMGIAWNKNRALFLLSMLLQCGVVLLLEDDSSPVNHRWEQTWIAASLRWGYISFAAEWLPGDCLRGSGTVDDPYLSTTVTAPCSGFSQTALLSGSYIDSRFRGFAQEHTEHIRRLICGGFGGSHENIHGDVVPTYRLLQGGLAVRKEHTYLNRGEHERNALMCGQVLFDETDRMPWCEDAERRQLPRDSGRHTARFGHGMRSIAAVDPAPGRPHVPGVGV